MIINLWNKFKQHFLSRFSTKGFFGDENNIFIILMMEEKKNAFDPNNLNQLNSPSNSQEMKLALGLIN